MKPTDENNNKNLNDLEKDGDLSVESENAVENDLSYDVIPELESGIVKKGSPIVSQAVLDLNQHDGYDDNLNKTSQKISKKEAQKARQEEKKIKASNVSGRVAKFRWFFLFGLSFLGILAWFIDAQFGYDATLANPYKIYSFIVLGLAVLITACSFRFVSMQTGAGLMALLWGGTFFVMALYGSVNSFLQLIPFSLYWSVVLTLFIFWVLVEVCFIISKYTVIGTILAAIVAYAATTPVFALFKKYTSGESWFPFEKDLLLQTPELITTKMPWFIWPFTVLILFVFTLGIFFCFKNQIRNLRFSSKKHFGNIFLALAFICIMAVNILIFSSLNEAFVVEANSEIASDSFAETLGTAAVKIKNVSPQAEEWQKANKEKILAIDKVGIVKDASKKGFAIEIPKEAPKEVLKETPKETTKEVASTSEVTSIVESKNENLETKLPLNNKEIKVSVNEEAVDVEETKYTNIPEEVIEDLSKQATQGPESSKTGVNKITAVFTDAVNQPEMMENIQLDNKNFNIEISPEEETNKIKKLSEVLQTEPRPSFKELNQMAEQIIKAEQNLKVLNLITQEQGLALEKAFEALGIKKPANLNVPYPVTPLEFEKLDYNNLYLNLLQNRVTNIENISINLQYMLEEQKILLNLLNEILLENKENEENEVFKNENQPLNIIPKEDISQTEETLIY